MARSWAGTGRGSTSAAVRWLCEHVQRGDLGTVLYVYAQRLNLGRVRRDVNVLWNLAPHDVSILLHVLDAQPIAVTAQGHGYLRADVEDVVFATLEFPGGCLGGALVSAASAFSWFHCARKICPAPAPERLEVQASCRPSGEGTGSPSKPSE